MLQMNKNEARVTGDTGVTGVTGDKYNKTSFPRPASSHCRTDSTVGAKRAPAQSELASGPSEDLELERINQQPRASGSRAGDKS